MGLKQTVEDGIERIDDKLYEYYRPLDIKASRYDRNHPRPNAIDNSFTGVLGTIGLASEVAAIKLAAKPKTIPRVAAQVGLHGLAAGATFFAGRVHEHAVQQGPKN